MKSRTIQYLVSAAAAFLVAASTAAAQDHDHSGQDEPEQAEHQHVMPPASTGAWTWSTDANVFLGYNYQQRRFADFSALESQNWFMVAGERRVGVGTLTLDGMFSLEPWTIGRLVYGNGHGIFDATRVYAFTANGQRAPVGGSPQAFQTGESYLGSPLINYQHPHDLFMGLGATYRFAAGAAKYTVAADLVGAPALGPTSFMHRDSARDNPSVPLTHHYMDSTHITTGVVTAGVEVGHVTLETSRFRGEEPDENRLDIDQPRLDSWSVRGSWRSGPWSAQVSRGRLDKPEWFEPVDVIRTTASVGFDGAIGSRKLAMTAAWGRNRDVGLFALDGYLLEWDLGMSARNTVYGRAESMLKEIIGLGVHPAGLLNHPRNLSHVDALTVGYVREVPLAGWDRRFGIGADITVYRTSADLVEFYGSPKSYHLFLRWRPTATAAPAHTHH